MKGTNDIENSYRDRFDSSSIKNEGWNNPRGIVWEKIEKDLFNEKRKKFGFIPFLMMGFLIMTLIFSFYLYSQNLELKNIIQEASSNREANINNNDHLVSSLIEEPIDKRNESVVPIDNDQNTIESPPKYFDKNVVSNNIPIDNLTDINNDKFNEIVIASLKEEGNDKSILDIGLDAGLNKLERENISGNLSGVIESKKVVHRGVQKVSSLTLINIDLEYDREVTYPKIILLEEEEVVRRPYISFLPNIAVGLLQTSGKQETALSELIDKEYGNTGLGFDLMYTLPVHKSIDFSVGLGIESINFSTEYDIILPYMIEDETVEGEKGFIDFEHSLPTAFGNTDTALRLSRKRASDALNESNVNLDFNTQHNFVSLSLPIGLKYRFGTNKSFVNLGLSARPTFIVNANSSIQSVFSHHSGIDAINNESISTYSNIRKLNVGLGFEIGYNLFLTEKSGLNFNLSLHDYLFDFYRVNEFSSSVRKAGVSLGYLHSF